MQVYSSEFQYVVAAVVNNTLGTIDHIKGKIWSHQVLFLRKIVIFLSHIHLQNFKLTPFRRKLLRIFSSSAYV
jgi:hypothetical protein